MLDLKGYQQRSLDALESCLRLAGQHGAKMAFLRQTERPYGAVPQPPGLPYICLRVPPPAARPSWRAMRWVL